MTTTTSSDTQELDWNQVNETVTMLDLAVTQLGWTLRDGDQSFNTLTNSFSQMIGAVEDIIAVAKQMPAGESKALILNHGTTIMARVHDAIVAFQFYDQLSQRLNHAADSLTDLRRLVSDPLRLYEPNEWRALQQLIRERYPTEADKIMFDAVLQGATLEEAIALFEQQQALNDQPAEIEFF